jgi:hypothetical protein
MKYIHTFESEPDFLEQYNGESYEEPWVSYTKVSNSGRVDYNHGDNYIIVRSGVWNGSDEPVDIKTTVFKSLTVDCQSVWDAISYKMGSYTEGGLQRDQDIIYIDDAHAGGYNWIPSQENVCDKVGALLDNRDNQFYDVETNTFNERLAGTVFDVRWAVGMA